eukprot:SM000084S23091  [mRNA]  locus=s84:35311:38401:+ [translate_table: standard]
MAVSIFALGPLLRVIRTLVFQQDAASWEDSRTHYIFTSYVRPLLVWAATIALCRGLEPIQLASPPSQAIKERFLNFVRSLATVLAFAFCTASLTQQVQRLMMERQDHSETRNVGVQFVGNTVYTLVWIAAVCLFMELLGFSTQKWITAGGFGTVLLTLAGREIVTNFLSSIMIHATRPFMVNEWIQTKIEGQEVSGTVEHVGWWEPTIIRGDDREAVHIPNHKFSMSVVRNLSQKTHWRIKTYFGISHLDAHKISDIVAGMRKVVAKYPQVEQKNLHRRVFLDSIDPENQALMILISCFVKTSHFEEYLRVKETLLLDLMRVIGYHNARLATPIRSVQRVLDNSEMRNTPFRAAQKPLTLEGAANGESPQSAPEVASVVATPPAASTPPELTSPPTAVKAPRNPTGGAAASPSGSGAMTGNGAVALGQAAPTNASKPKSSSAGVDAGERQAASPKWQATSPESATGTFATSIIQGEPAKGPKAAEQGTGTSLDPAVRTELLRVAAGATSSSASSQSSVKLVGSTLPAEAHRARHTADRLLGLAGGLLDHTRMELDDPRGEMVFAASAVAVGMRGGGGGDGGGAQAGGIVRDAGRAAEEGTVLEKDRAKAAGGKEEREQKQVREEDWKQGRERERDVDKRLEQEQERNQQDQEGDRELVLSGAWGAVASTSGLGGERGGGGGTAHAVQGDGARELSR